MKYRKILEYALFFPLILFLSSKRVKQVVVVCFFFPSLFSPYFEIEELCRRRNVTRSAAALSLLL